MSVADSMESIREHLFSSLPEDWTPKPLKRVARFVEGPGIMAADFQDDGVPLLRIAGLAGRTASLEGCNFLSPSLVEQKWSHFRVRVGDLLISGSASTGLCAEVDEETVGAIPYTGIIIIRPVDDQADRDFLRWFFLSEPFAMQVTLAQTGSALQHFGPTHLSEMLVPIAPIRVQRAIADYLDRETSRLDALIAAKERLVGWLAEKRRALVTRAVTRGIDPAVPLRDSGVPWLGKIPAHWGIVQSRRLFRVRNEPARDSDRQLTASQKYGMIFQSDFVEREGRRVVELIDGADSLRHAEPNDFVISLRSFQGGLEWCRLAGSVTFHYVVLVPIKNVYEPFFAHLFKSSAYIQALRSTASLIRDGQDLRYSHFVLVDLPWIPLEEQAKIASYLDRETARLDRLLAEIRNSVPLLRERRAAVIAAAVTGQIEVEAA